MDKSTKILNIIKQRQPLARNIKSVDENLRNLSGAIAKLDNYCHQIISEIEDPTVLGKLREIDFGDVQLRIARELESLTKLKNRFSRDTLNIGVIGRARQGKSRLLQTITGLTKAEIPDGDRQDCTGVRSTIHHNRDVDTYGEVWFHSQRSFLEEVIYPYYDQLRLGRKPVSVQEFIQEPLPSLPSDLPGYAEPGAMYEHLQRYYNYYDEYKHLFQEISPKKINKFQIREYVAQDTLEGNRIFNYLAVKEVKITCSFPNLDVSRISLIDLPGLGDTGIGDQEKMIKTIANDIDFILFVRMPKSTGDSWRDFDVKLYDTARSALIDLPIDLWSVMLLNQTDASSKNGDNLPNCEDFLSSIKNKHLNVKDCYIANCTDTIATNQVLDGILDYLSNELTNLDKKYASACQERILNIYQILSVQLSTLRNIFGRDSEDDYQDNEELYTELFGDTDSGWWEKIMLSFQELRTDLWYQRKAPNDILYEQFMEAIELCEENRGILSSENALAEIKRKIKLISPFRAYPDYQDELRVLISSRFISLDQSLKTIIEEVKNKVANIFKNDGGLTVISGSGGSEFFQEMANLIPDKYGKLKKGFEIIAEFRLSYRGLILPRIRQHLDVLTNISALTGESNLSDNNIVITLEVSKDTSNQEILDALDIDYEKAINTIRSALEDLLYEPNEACYAIVEEFIDNVIHQKDAKKEWKNFLRGLRGIIWPDQFGKKEREIQLRKELANFINQIENLNQVHLLSFS